MLLILYKNSRMEDIIWFITVLMKHSDRNKFERFIFSKGRNVNVRIIYKLIVNDQLTI